MLLSRIAENVYWTGRYLERAEATARVVAAHTEIFLDLPRAAGASWESLLAVVGGLDEFQHDHDDLSEEAIVHWLTADAENPGSVVSSIARARHNMRTVRSLFPRSAWEIVNELHLCALDRAGGADTRPGRLAWIDSVTARVQRLTGMLADTMTHDDAYSFFSIGRHVERADMTTRVLDVQAAALLDGIGTLRPYSDVSWMGVLNAVAGTEAYRRSGQSRISGRGVVSFLLHDGQFPRSVDRCLTEISRSLLELPRYDGPMARTAAVQRLVEESKLMPVGPAAGWAVLRGELDEMQIGFARLDRELADAYFPRVSLTPPALLSA